MRMQPFKEIIIQILSEPRDDAGWLMLVIWLWFRVVFLVLFGLLIWAVLAFPPASHPDHYNCDGTEGSTW